MVDDEVAEGRPGQRGPGQEVARLAQGGWDVHLVGRVRIADELVLQLEQAVAADLATRGATARSTPAVGDAIAAAVV